jgi:hypothetical protein
MADFDMQREPESKLPTGTNLWEVREAKVERSQSGAGSMMLTFKFKCGESELRDRAMLEGGGMGIGQRKLAALGMPAMWRGSWDDLAIVAREFIGRKVWIATVEGKFEGIDKKSGKKKWFTKLEVDIDQLESAGYQTPEKVPSGASVTVAGLGPDEPEPF